jgi:acyl-CoA dehydrogenase
MADKSFLGWPFFDDEHRALASAIDGWAAEHVATMPEAGEETVDEACRELVERLADAGWLDYAVPGEGAGGHETLEVRSLCILRETLARYHGLADFVFATQGLGSGPLSLFGSEEQRSRYLSGVRRGEKIAAFALSEPEAGSDVASIATTAVEDGDHYAIDGTKTWISNGGLADYYTVFARTADAPGAKGLSAFIVDAETPGLRVLERIPVIAPHPLATLEFDGCRVPQSQLLRAAELTVIIDKAQISHALTDARLVEELETVREDVPVLSDIMIFGPEGELEKRMEAKPPAFETVETAAEDGENKKSLRVSWQTLPFWRYTRTLVELS